MSGLKVKQSRLDTVPASLQPALRAYLLGYLLDALPTILKQLLRYTLVNLKNLAKIQKRIAEERLVSDKIVDGPRLDAQLSAAARTSVYSDAVWPALQQLPALLHQMGQSLIAALGPRGVALACALCMGGTVFVESTLNTIFVNPHLPFNLRQRRAVLSTFASTAACSAMALQLLQYSAYGMNNSKNDTMQFKKGFYRPFKRAKSVIANPTPLAPGGNFLARLTSLSIPATPKDSLSRSPSEKISQIPSSPEDEKAPGLRTMPTKKEENKKLGSASPTIDLTLFALVRALDTLVRAVPALRNKTPPSRALGPQGGMKADNMSQRLAGLHQSANMHLSGRILQRFSVTIRDQAEGLTFVVACAIIMYNWFYSPERLPPSYVKWITNLASMDNRLLLALRSLRKKQPHAFIYGDKNSTPACIDMCGSLSESLGHPYSWGDPSQLPATKAEAIRQKKIAQANKTEYLLQDAAGLRGQGKMAGMPCEIVHCGVGGANCYKNALYRFLKAYKVCLGIYIPVHLLPRLIFGFAQLKRQPLDTLIKVLKGSMRSAAFLSTFISSIW